MSVQHSCSYPRRGNRLSRAFGAGLLRALGWRIADDFPDLPKAVIIGCPHTSNWDTVVTLAAMLEMQLDGHVMIKDSAFKGPVGPLLRWLGGLPIDRNKAGGIVEQSVAQFQQRDKLMLVLAPEGTRSGASAWKTGFYRIALQAGVPIIAASADYRKKEVRFPAVVEPSGDMAADLERLYQSFNGVTPRHPEKLSAPLRAARGESTNG